MKRVVTGVALGVTAGAIVTFGGWPFTALLALIAYQATQEYFKFITSKGISKGMTPPPPLVTVCTSVLCVGITISAHFLKAKGGLVLAIAAFCLLVLNVVAERRPKFAQLTSSLFGVFYCGWLPSYWIKLRAMGMPLPDHATLTHAIASVTPWTVGLYMTFTTVACIIAADTGAYFVGKTLGRTKLTDISPKKTVEGALGGLASSVAVSLALWYVVQWPVQPAMAVVNGVLVFFASLFGDLIESIMKRDAELKDSGDLIPGHGGLLDRIDSYMFTGAVVYAFVHYVLGV